MTADDRREALATAWWAVPAAQLLAALDTRPAGLSSTEARARLAAHGANEVAAAQQDRPARLLWRQFTSPLVLILVVGAALSLVLRDWVDATTILVIVIGSALLGFGQELAASNAVARLRRRLALLAQVRRDGGVAARPVRELVPGDVVELAAGHLVPADGVLLEARDFLVNQASLTGESFPVEKQPGIAAPTATLAERFDAGAARFHTAWFFVSLCTELAVLMVLRTRGASWRSRPARWLTGTTVTVLALALALPYSGALAAVLGFEPLPLPLLATLVSIVLAYCAATEAAKRWFWRRVLASHQGRVERSGRP